MSSTETAVAEAAAPDVAAESSAAEGDKGSVLDAVKASLNPTEESPTSRTGEETTEAAPDKDAAVEGEEPAEDPLTLTDAEKKVLSPRAQERFRTLASRSKAAETQVKALSPKAENFDRIVAFNRQHGISSSEFNNTLELLRISKSDPNKAFDLVSGLLQNLAHRTGKALSPELQERIRLGHINEQDARRLSQSEADAKLAREQAEARTEAAAQERHEREWTAQVTTATAAVDEWAKAQAASDPDWSKKMPHMTRALELELRSGGPDGYPKTKADAVALAEKIKKQVEADLKPFKPQKQAIALTVADGSSSRNQAEPQSMAEAIKLSLAK